MKYRLKDVCMRGNEHGQLASNVIYAKLVDDNGLLVISATLDYILIKIREIGLEVEGVTLSTYERGGVVCSKVSLDLY